MDEFVRNAHNETARAKLPAGPDTRATQLALVSKLLDVATPEELRGWGALLLERGEFRAVMR